VFPSGDIPSHIGLFDCTPGVSRSKEIVLRRTDPALSGCHVEAGAPRLMPSLLFLSVPFVPSALPTWSLLFSPPQGAWRPSLNGFCASMYPRHGLVAIGFEVRAHGFLLSLFSCTGLPPRDLRSDGPRRWCVRRAVPVRSVLRLSIAF